MGDAVDSSLQPTPRPHSWVLPALLFIAMAIAFIVLFKPSLGAPFERDEGEYAWAAHLLQQGGVPYRDTFLQKPPGIILVYRTIFATLGTSITAVHVGLLITHLITALLLLGLGRAMLNLRVGFTTAALYLCSVFMPAYQALSANTEEFMIIPVIGAAWCLWSATQRPRLGPIACAGLLLGSAVMVKQVAFYHGVIAGLLLLWIAPNWSKRIVWGAIFAVCCAVPFLLALAWMAALGAVPDFLDAILWHNLEYVSTDAGRQPMMMLYYRWIDSKLFDHILWILAIAGIVRLVIRPRTRMLGMMLAGWLVTALFAISSGYRFFGHYFVQAIPAICLSAALLIWKTHVLVRWAAFALLGFAWIFAGPMIVGNYDVQLADRYYDQGARFSNSPRLAEVIRSVANPGDALYVLGSEPQLHYYSGLRNVTPYVISNPLFGGFKTSHARQLKVWNAIRRDPPDFIVRCHPDASIPIFPTSDRFLLDQVDALIAQRYEPIVFSRFMRPGILPANVMNDELLPELILYRLRPPVPTTTTAPSPAQ